MSSLGGGAGEGVGVYYNVGASTSKILALVKGGWGCLAGDGGFGMNFTVCVFSHKK